MRCRQIVLRLSRLPYGIGLPAAICLAVASDVTKTIRKIA